MNDSLKPSLLLAAAVIMVAVVVTVSLRSFEQTRRATDARLLSFVILRSEEALLGDLKDAETGQRGYLLTGDPLFLQPYLAIRDRVGGRLAELHRMGTATGSGPHLDALGPLITAKMAELSRVIELRRRNEPAAVAMVREGDGRRTMDAIRGEMTALARIEEAELAGREVDLRSDLRLLLALIIAGSLMALLFSLGFAYTLRLHTRQRLLGILHIDTRKAQIGRAHV